MAQHWFIDQPKAAPRARETLVEQIRDVFANLAARPAVVKLVLHLHQLFVEVTAVQEFHELNLSLGKVATSCDVGLLKEGTTARVRLLNFKCLANRISA